VDGRIDDPDIREAIEIRMALILGGGYPKTARRLSVKQREAVISAASEMCAKCGAPGIDIDHIKGSSADPENLQLLCHKCHLAKTQSVMVPAPADLVEGVYRPIVRRARNEVPNQPCDTTDWNYKRWAANEPKYPQVMNNWSIEFPIELDEQRLDVSVFDAAEGFPRHLDSWNWY
jgi:hypothetical protein